MSITQTFFGLTKANEKVSKYILSNKNGMQVHCIDFGCRITNLFYPGENGETDLVLGYDTLEAYEADTSGQGAIVGRYANRIENAEFTLNGLQYKLTANDGANYLHGNFQHQVFNAGTLGKNTISFTHASPESTDGFPGEMLVCITYTLTEENELVMDFSAATSADSPVNISNHSYFNLSGAGNGNILNHELRLFADSFLEVNNQLCPTGNILPVAGSAMDFLRPKPIGRDINSGEEQLELAGGYDHCYVINNEKKSAMNRVATVTDPASGRRMSVYTTQPAVQFYTGNFLDASIAGKNGQPMQHHGGFCLETQHYPSSPTHPSFPNTILKKGKQYHEVAVYVFG